MPKGREERTNSQGLGPQRPMKKQPGIGTPRPMIKEHSQQQADKCEVLLKVVLCVTATQCDQAAASADVPEDVPQGVKTDPQNENVDEKGSGESWESVPEVQEGRGRMFAQSNPQSPS